MDSSLASPVTLDLFAIVLGLVIGSFLNVCIWRLPRDLSIVAPRSFCPSCERPIPWHENIPVLSYLLLRGKCRACGAPISLRYPLVEIGTAALSWLVWRKYGASAGYPLYFAFAASLLLVSAIDLEHRIIPDVVSIPGAVIGLLYAGLSHFLHFAHLPSYVSFADSAIGVLAGGGSLYLVAFLYGAATGREGLGGGDIKLMAMVGAFLGWKGALFSIFVGSLLGSVVGVAVMIVKKADGKLPIPFGPFLSGAALLYLAAGDRMIDTYWTLLGADGLP